MRRAGQTPCNARQHRGHRMALTVHALILLFFIFYKIITPDSTVPGEGRRRQRL